MWVDANKHNEPEYTVEGVEGLMFNRELKFFIKWENYPRSLNTYEPLEDLKNCATFREYIGAMYSKLEDDIELKSASLRNKLKYRIIASLRRPKREVFNDIISFNKYEFMAHQVAFHLLPSDNAFNKIFEDMFVAMYIVKLEKKQHVGLTQLVVEIRKVESSITVDIENTVDFSLPRTFKYIASSINIVNTIEIPSRGGSTGYIDSGWGHEERGENPVVSNNHTLSKHILRPALLIFKTNKCGWGLGSLQTIEEGCFVVECVGEVLNQHQVEARIDQAFVFPVKLVYFNESYSIDARRFGNLSRFINHSCRPNCRIVVLHTGGESSIESKHLIVIATTLIHALDEITIDYSKHIQPSFECFCDSPECKKFIEMT